MMRPSNNLSEIYLCLQPVDFRKGMISLAAMVERELGLNPFNARLFVFTNRYRNRVRILYWERNGFEGSRKGISHRFSKAFSPPTWWP